MSDKRKANSVRSLSSLYTVVIGVALSLSVVTLIDSAEGLASLTIDSVALFSAFVVTLIPFYHGALRHLDDAYIETDATHIKNGALVIDVLLLIMHGIGFVLLALLLQKPFEFGWILISVLFIDVVWGGIAFFGFSASEGDPAEGKWTLINIGFLVVTGCFIYVVQNVQELSNLSGFVSVGIFSACFIRTLVDYIWCSQFYFPAPD